MPRCLLISLALLFLGGCAVQPSLPVAGEEFRDCEDCPVMRVVPAGTFVMGSPPAEPGRLDHEGPQHTVTFARPFAIGKFEVTFAEYDACHRAGACQDRVPDFGWGRGRRPVIALDYNQMNAYLYWLTWLTGHLYRLPSEAEWEYAARGGTDTAYYWGDEPDPDFANFGAPQCCAGAAAGRDIWMDQTAPAGSFPPNAFGLYDMLGNASERVRDCWNPSYAGAPADGSEWRDGDCAAPGLRGGSWISSPELMRAAERDAFHGYYRANVVGFRVVREF